ncbi:hypothetical protein ABMA27_005218 [Loxostege sticticalis]|uniref:Integrase catalytic domain-containing protein n=1 Tax=Loxostege sticticalis TaxID=481309 RepID=A0ABR3HM59_LOXSC
MLTRLQSKALESSAGEAPQPDSGTVNDVEPPLPALVLDPVGSVYEADDKSISETSKSSSTIRARSLNIKALYARKIAEAEAKAAEAEAAVERKRAAKVVEAERRALEMEMRAEIAQIEAEGSSRRGSSRASSPYDASKASYSSMENLSRVNAALYGPAREAVGALLSTANNPGDIISVLELQFGRPELIVLQEVAAVRALPKVNFEGKDLHFFAGRSRFNPIVGTKLELLADFLVEEVTTEFQFGVISEANLLSQPTFRQPTFRQPTFRTAVVDSSPNTYTSKASVNKNHPQISISCLYCHKSHIIDNCDKFIRLDFMARLNWAREQKVCNRCLKKGSHRYRSCNPKTLCNVEGCKYKHHKLLHNYESVNSHTTTETLSNGIEPEPSCSTMPIESKSETVAHAISNGPLKALLKVVPVTVSGPKGSINTYALLDDGSSSTFIDDEVSAHIGAVGPKAQIRVECMGGLSKLTEVEYVDFCIQGVTTSDDFSEIEGLIKDNFKLESIGIVKQRVRSAADERATKIHEDTARRLPGGQFEVGLLWQSDVTDIPDSYPLAFSRFNGLEKRFRKDAAYAQQYSENIHAMIDKGYAEPCDISSDSTRVWYLPHFGVVNPNKPGKLRVVHDAAARSQGVSLNSLLLTGPDLLPSLLNIIYRFREGKIGMIADVKEMFPLVKIRPEDRDAQRFLWRDSPDLPLSTYRMSSMIFGAASSPFTALYLKNKNAEEFRDLYPEAAHAIVEDTYMDDFIGSLEGLDEATQLARDIVEVQERAHFEVRGWVSNEPEALTLIPPNLKLDSGSTGVDIGHFPQSVRTLGLIWYPSTDELGFNTAALKTSLALPQKITKRHALSSMMRVFDPLGVLAPSTIKARIIFQVVWRRGIDWDQELPQDLSTKWKAWLADVSSAVDIRVPRWHLREAHIPNQAHLIERELHVFCDASEHAYVAVAYWRLVLPDKTVQVSFICSKSRVAPLTPVTISRLELQAATVAARLATSICDAHKFKPSRRFLWTDSKNVLGWLRSDARSFLPFVAHRLADILELSSLDEWRWVPTALNVADDATRQKSDADLKNSRWIEGPVFLKSPQYDWPVEPHNTRLNKDELKPSAKIHSYLIQVGTIPVHHVSADPSRFSQWLRFLRSTARAHQYIRRLRCRANAKASTSHTPASRLRTSVAQLTPLTAEDLRLAQLHILIKCQNDSFPDELAALRLGEPLPRHSKLQKLHVILGNDGLMTLSGRIGAVAESTEATNFPIVLDGSHPAVKLLTHYYHRRFAHGNNETVVNELRQQFWILKLRSTVRAAAHACQYCKIRKAIPLNPPVGNLPAVRLAHHRRPFTFVGLDYFGPVQITVGRRHEKRWVALFTCLTTRAVHLEVVHDLSTDAALMALRRFTARRGSPQQIWSDNGTAFVGAAKFMRELYGPAVQEFATNQNIDWIFIPPSAPSMGGAWERLVRSVKSALKVTLQERAPKEPVLTTLLMEAEAVVNSRPLTYVPTDSNDEEALTPFHFLIGTASTANHYGKTEPQDLWGRSLWRKALRLTDLFWNRWEESFAVPAKSWCDCLFKGLSLSLSLSLYLSCYTSIILTENYDELESDLTSAKNSLYWNPKANTILLLRNVTDVDDVANLLHSMNIYNVTVITKRRTDIDLKPLEGTEYEILKIWRHIDNVTVDIVAYDGAENWKKFYGELLENKTYTGMLSWIAENRVEGAVGGYGLRIDRCNGLDYAYPHLVDQLRMIIRHNEQLDYDLNSRTCEWTSSNYLYLILCDKTHDEVSCPVHLVVGTQSYLNDFILLYPVSNTILSSKLYITYFQSITCMTSSSSRIQLA